jgi:hypothetical protein
MYAVNQKGNNDMDLLKTEMDAARDRALKRSTYLRDAKSLVSLAVTDIRGITLVSLITSLYCLAIMLTCFILYGVNKDSVSKQSVQLVYPVLDSTGTDLKYAFTFNPTLWSGIALTIPVLVSIVSFVMKSSVSNELSRGSSMVRWFGESLFAPLTQVILLASWGVNDVFSLAGIFAMTHASIVFISVMDVVNYPGKKGVSWWPYYLSIWLGVLAFLPTILLLITSGSDLSGLPMLTQWSLGLLLTSSISQLVLQRSYYKSVDNPTDSNILLGPINSLMTTEFWLSIFGTPLRVTAILLLAVAYLNDSSWVKDHSLTTKCMVEVLPLSKLNYVPESCMQAIQGAGFALGETRHTILLNAAAVLSNSPWFASLPPN